MEIEQQSFKRVDLVTVTGRVDGSNWSELDGAFRGLQNDGRYNIVVDLAGVEYMSSAGLRALVAALRESKNHKGDLRIANPSKRIADVLSLAGLDTVFSIYDDSTSAIGSF
jgi:anti-sigma B factor antagonist